MTTKPKIKAKDKADATIKSNTTQVDTLSQLKPTDYRGSISAVPWGQVAARLCGCTCCMPWQKNKTNNSNFSRCACDLTRRVCFHLIEDERRVFLPPHILVQLRRNFAEFELQNVLRGNVAHPWWRAEMKSFSTAAGGQSKPRMLPGTKLHCNMTTFSY